MVVENPVINDVLIKVIKEINSFSFSEISNILELNNIKIFSISIVKIDSNNVVCNINVKSNHLVSSLNLLRAYEYEIISDHNEDDFLDELKNRSRYLDKYLNM
jgi:hypothetical protein